jgi:hypothetical protein
VSGGDNWTVTDNIVRNVGGADPSRYLIHQDGAGGSSRFAGNTLRCGGMSGVRVGNNVVEVVDNRIQAFGSGGTGVGIDNPSNNNTTLRGNYGRISDSSAATMAAANAPVVP